MSFHVPESARLLDHPLLGTTSADGNNGAFKVSSPEPGWTLFLICSDGSDPTSGHRLRGDRLSDTHMMEKWEHVSVHARRDHGQQLRTPTWKEMVFVKDLCWDGEDVVMQLHPRRSEYVNNHPHVLHLWRPLQAVIPEPPSVLVGVKG